MDVAIQATMVILNSGIISWDPMVKSDAVQITCVLNIF